ncbi:RNA polymerase sigma factor [Paenibacillus donghaensis]|uniref:RNA polymerase subunit sigma-70 n=1 Tax=Paenibacillus donghaensis TaxID=414771 RepID=A0A2Z2KDZ3_9BACL|nr:sigma-70 family RNA polymerase sigma factor [Paenibacillus donghaensis]ASA23907.1 RNA polymerase subunit sigma-70 [Paenibacillus donghaensis]
MELESLQYAEEMNESQLREIMNIYGEDVWHYIYYLTKNTGQADDLAQEVFIKCYYRICTYRGESSFKAWLLTIARNTVFTYRKSRFYRTSLWGGVQPLVAGTEEQELPLEQLGTTRSAEMEYLGNSQAQDIWAVIMALPDKYREVLVLDLKYGLTIKEIAGMAGLPQGTVKSRLHRARQKVQSKLRGAE